MKFEGKQLWAVDTTFEKYWDRDAIWIVWDSNSNAISIVKN